MSRSVPGFVSEANLAAMLGLSVSGLRAWRRRGYGPKAQKIGKSIFYPDASVANFLADPTA